MPPECLKGVSPGRSGAMSQYVSSILKLTNDGISSLAMTASLLHLQTQTLDSFPYYSVLFQGLSVASSRNSIQVNLCQKGKKY